jgi:hypothetical protein
VGIVNIQVVGQDLPDRRCMPDRSSPARRDEGVSLPPRQAYFGPRGCQNGGGFTPHFTSAPEKSIGLKAADLACLLDYLTVISPFRKSMPR